MTVMKKVVIIVLGIIGIGVWLDQSSLWTVHTTFLREGTLTVYTNINWPIFLGGLIAIIALTALLYKVVGK